MQPKNQSDYDSDHKEGRDAQGDFLWNRNGGGHEEDRCLRDKDGSCGDVMPPPAVTAPGAMRHSWRVHVAIRACSAPHRLAATTENSVTEIDSENVRQRANNHEGYRQSPCFALHAAHYSMGI